MTRSILLGALLTLICGAVMAQTTDEANLRRALMICEEEADLSHKPYPYREGYELTCMRLLNGSHQNEMMDIVRADASPDAKAWLENYVGMKP